MSIPKNLLLLKETMNIEIEITLRCNASCMNCNRFCNMIDLGIDYSDSDMGMEDIKKFIEAVKNHGDIFRVTIIGGEPTLNKNFNEICAQMKKELFDTGIIKDLVVSSNGINTFKTDIQNVRISVTSEKHQKHICHLMAPCDTNQERIENYSCAVINQCGIAYNKYGIYPCGPGGALVRLFKLKNLTKSSLPKGIRDFGDLEEMCKRCQMSAKTYLLERENNRIISKSFQEIINGL